MLRWQSGMKTGRWKGRQASATETELPANRAKRPREPGRGGE